MLWLRPGWAALGAAREGAARGGRGPLSEGVEWAAGSHGTTEPGGVQGTPPIQEKSGAKPRW